MKSREDVFLELANLMEELFEIPVNEIKMESRFYDDLDLDSIDAIDLIGRFQEMYGQRINPEDFNEVRTVGDIVIIAEKMSQSQSSEA